LKGFAAGGRGGGSAKKGDAAAGQGGGSGDDGNFSCVPHNRDGIIYDDPASAEEIWMVAICEGIMFFFFLER
jgi:hypothetical protein